MINGNSWRLLLITWRTPIVIAGRLPEVQTVGIEFVDGIIGDILIEVNSTPFPDGVLIWPFMPTRHGFVTTPPQTRRDY